MAKKYQKPKVVLTSRTADLLYTLLANLLVPDNAHPELQVNNYRKMVRQIDDGNMDEYIPADMVAERQMLRAIIYCDQNNLVPTVSRVKGLLKADGVQTAAVDVDRIMGYRPDYVDVEAASEHFDFAMIRERVVLANERNKQMMDNPLNNGKPVHELVTTMIDNLRTADPVLYSYRDYNTDSLLDDLAREQESITRNYQTYGVALPPIPFKGLQEAMAGLTPGDPVALTGLTGTGKSTMLLHMAMYYARLPYYALYITHETTKTSITRRMLSYNLGIPMVAFRKPFKAYGIDTEFAPISLRDPFWQPALEYYREHFIKPRQGKLIIAPMFDATLSDILDKIRKHAEIAKAEGRQLVVINDYIQKWNLKGVIGDREDQRMGQAADDFKALCMAMDVCAIIGAQTTKSSDTGDPKVKGAQSVTEKWQGHLHIRSERRDETDAPEWVTYNGEDGRRQVAINFLGFGRKYNSTRDSGQAAMKIIKSNDSEVGLEVGFRYERPLYRVYDTQEPPHQFELTIYDLLQLSGNMVR